MKWIKIKELNIDVAVQETGILFKDINLPKNARVCEDWELLYLFRNHKKLLGKQEYWWCMINKQLRASWLYNFSYYSSFYTSIRFVIDGISLRGVVYVKKKTKVNL